MVRNNEKYYLGQYLIKSTVRLYTIITWITHEKNQEDYIRVEIHKDLFIQRVYMKFYMKKASIF